MFDYDELDFEEQCEETNNNYIQDLKQKIEILEKAFELISEDKLDGMRTELKVSYDEALDTCRKNYIYIAKQELENDKK